MAFTDLDLQAASRPRSKGASAIDVVFSGKVWEKTWLFSFWWILKMPKVSIELSMKLYHESLSSVETSRGYPKTIQNLHGYRLGYSIFFDMQDEIERIETTELWRFLEVLLLEPQPILMGSLSHFPCSAASPHVCRTWFHPGHNHNHGRSVWCHFFQ